jgi:hypothetical protein
MIEGSEETHAVRLAGGEVILAVNKDADEPFLICDCSRNNILGADIFENGIVSADYLEIMREFTKRLNGRMDSLEAERSARGIPYEILAEADCEPFEEDITGNVAVIKASSLAPEYRNIDSQLVLVTGGNGAKPEAIGRAVFCKELYSGVSVRWERRDIAGTLPPDRLPEWAKEKLAALQKPAEKESVLEKIRQDRQGKKTNEPKPKNKKQNKSDPEL